MQILVYSDVHGNLPAFEELLKRETSVGAYICLGDLVNYGPWSNECVQLALSLNHSRIIKGNHEQAFIDGYYPGSNQLVKDFFAVCYTGFEMFEEIVEFLPEMKDYGFRFQHTLNDSYVYPDTKIELDDNYVIGHSHHQFVYHFGNFALYNPGSVGQNRKYINVVNYMIYDVDRAVFELKAFSYNMDKLIAEMRNRNYPEQCLNYYLNKETV